MVRVEIALKLKISLRDNTELYKLADFSSMNKAT